MRISDWISDMCSSDLDAGGQARRRARDAAGQLRKQGHALGFSAIVAFGEEDERMRPLPYPLITVGDHPGRSEERRVGKGVSVRVDLGGRRLIKKKIITKQENQTKKPHSKKKQL